MCSPRAIEARCACGCGTQLDPAGNSAWFASPDCQREFHGRQATDPDDVYNRFDAADYPEWDSQTVPLNDPRSDYDRLEQAVGYHMYQWRVTAAQAAAAFHRWGIEDSRVHMFINGQHEAIGDWYTGISFDTAREHRGENNNPAGTR